MSELYALYKKLGKQAYGKAISEIAPYFSTISPHFVALRPGYCEVTIENQRAIHNHLGFIHVIAICNAAELCAGVVTDVSIPDEHHWIPVGMKTRYLAKAQSDIRVIADADDIDWSLTGSICVNVEAFDTNNIKVFQGSIEMLVRKKNRLHESGS